MKSSLDTGSQQQEVQGLLSISKNGTLWNRTYYGQGRCLGSLRAYSAVEGKHGDAIAYYSGLGFVMDMTWLLIVAVFAWRVLSSEYFRTVVRPADPAWGWLERKFALPEPALLAFYRAFFFYGACRIISWSVWVHLVKGAPWDLSWGGPRWVAPFEPW